MPNAMEMLLSIVATLMVLFLGAGVIGLVIVVLDKWSKRK